MPAGSPSSDTVIAMADIQFEEDQQPYAQPSLAEDKPWSIRMLLKTGIIQGEQQAKYVLLGISLFFIALAAYIAFFSGGSSYRVPDAIVNAALKNIPPPSAPSVVPGMYPQQTPAGTQNYRPNYSL